MIMIFMMIMMVMTMVMMYVNKKHNETVIGIFFKMPPAISFDKLDQHIRGK